MTERGAWPRVSVGVRGLDEILHGGLPQGDTYVVQGGPGTGKTTLGLQFLREGVARGERVLYVTLSQSLEGLQRMAASHGWSLDGVDVHLFASAEEGEGEQTVFTTAEVELGETMRELFAAVERLDPTRVVFDSVAEFRLLSETSLRYRRQILEMKRFFAGSGCTVLFVDDDVLGGTGGDRALAGLTSGIVHLEQAFPAYGNVRRRLQIVKLRSTPFRGGHHDFRIVTGGLEVYPRLDDERGPEHTGYEPIETGVGELDALVGGGLSAGTSTVIMGPSGVGKTTLATLYAMAAARKGECAALFLFEERPETFYRRSEGLGIDVRPFVESGLVSIRQIDTGELSAGEFAHTVREEVEQRGVRVVVMDTLTGYVNAMGDQQGLISQMHELLNYLSHHGVLSLLVVAQHGVVGSGVIAPVDVSYMADAVLLLRHFEAEGTLRKAVSVVKKRFGDHEKTIRELRLAPGRIYVGEPIQEFRGILTGSPSFEGHQRQLIDDDGSHL